MIYFLRRLDGDIKIGYTGDDRYPQRYRALCGEFGSLEPLGYTDGTRQDETRLHHRFSQYRRTPIYKFDGGVGGHTEFFAPAPVILRYIRRYATPLPFVAVIPPRRRIISGVDFTVRSLTWMDLIFTVQYVANGGSMNGLPKAIDDNYAKMTAPVLPSELDAILELLGGLATGISVEEREFITALLSRQEIS